MTRDAPKEEGHRVAVNVTRVDVFGDPKISKIIAGDLEHQLQTVPTRADHWDVALVDTNGQFVVTCRGTRDRSSPPPAWTRMGTEGSVAGDVVVFQSAVELPRGDITPALRNVVEAIRELIEAP